MSSPDQAVRLALVHHHAAKGDGAAHLGPGVGQRHPLAPAAGVEVLGVALQLRLLGQAVYDAHAVQRRAQRLRGARDALGAAQ
jgi:hypothetical protein